MSIKYNGKTIAGGYTPPYATDNIYGITRIATDDELKEGSSKTTCITPYQLSNHGKKIFSNVSLSNLDIEGEKHFINKSQITNCLLEVPQYIKYDLTDGTLTIKAGSIVIVPYGTEDLSATYPVGSTFINENFKVVDTQFTDGKFFVWVELVNDITASTAMTGGNACFQFANISANEVSNQTVTLSTSGTTEPTSGVFYNTSSNLVYHISLKDIVFSLPLSISIIDEQKYQSVNQVFNGMGYIGSTVWVDKGVKGLIPNKRNEDGSLNNVEYTTEELWLYTNNASLSSGHLCVGLDVDAYSPYYEQDEQPTTSGLWFDTLNNCMRRSTDGGATWEVRRNFVVASYDNTNGVISNFNPKQPIRLVDSDNIDGQVVYCGEITIFNTTTIGRYTIDLSSYVPIDRHGYDLYICCAFGPDNSSDRHDRQVIIYDGTNTSTILARFTYDVANSQVEIPTIIPLSASAQSKITVKLYSSNSVPFSRAIIYLHAIRRRGNST